MKIVFWGSESECGITSNMLALASYLVCHNGFRVTIFEMTKESLDVEKYFPGTRRKYAKEYIDTLIEKGLYYVARPVSKQIIERIEWNMDIIFLHMGNRTDEEARQIMKEADVLAVNIKQEEKSFDSFLSYYGNLSARFVLLVGNYFETAACDMKYLQDKYSIPDEHIAVIPFNPEFQVACERGQLEKYMSRRRRVQMSETKRKFMQALEKVVQTFYKQTKKEMAH